MNADKKINPENLPEPEKASITQQPEEYIAEKSNFEKAEKSNFEKGAGKPDDLRVKTGKEEQEEKC